MAELVAVVELGSTAVRFALARVRRGRGFRILREGRVQTRLGDGRPGTLPAPAVRRTAEAVRRFLAEARRGAAPRVVAVATSAVREAADASRLRAALRGAGVRLRVLSAREEAWLGARAALGSLRLSEGVVVDLGGASLEVTRVRGGRLLATASLPLGTVRTTRRFLRHDPPTAREVAALRRAAAAALAPVVARLPRGLPLVGLGGTARALARMARAAGAPGPADDHGFRLRRGDVERLRERLLARSAAGRRRLPGLDAGRADIIVAGTLVLEELMRLGGFATLRVSTRGLRDGILLARAGAGRDTARRDRRAGDPRKPAAAPREAAP